MRQLFSGIVYFLGVRHNNWVDVANAMTSAGFVEYSGNNNNYLFFISVSKFAVQFAVGLLYFSA